MADEKVLIIANQRNYTVNAFQHTSADITYAYYKMPTILKGFRRVWHILNVGYFEIWYQFKKIDLKKYQYIILFECTYPIEIINYIRKINPYARLIYWLWNSVEKQGESFTYSGKMEIQKLISMKNKPGYESEIWTFDKNDCEKYNLNYNNQISYKIGEFPELEIEQDIFFCGKDKKRVEVLDNLKEILEKQKISFKFLLSPDKKNIYTKEQMKYLLKHEIQYEMIIKNELSSKCILDLVQEGQGGITWRPLEAMFYEKKMITNYKEIVQYDFYRKENIFILGKDNLDELKIFVNGLYQKLPNCLLEKYQYNSWIDNFG